MSSYLRPNQIDGLYFELWNRDGAKLSLEGWTEDAFSSSTFEQEALECAFWCPTDLVSYIMF